MMSPKSVGEHLAYSELTVAIRNQPVAKCSTHACNLSVFSHGMFGRP